MKKKIGIFQGPMLYTVHVQVSTAYSEVLLTTKTYTAIFSSYIVSQSLFQIFCTTMKVSTKSRHTLMCILLILYSEMLAPNYNIRMSCNSMLSLHK